MIKKTINKILGSMGYKLVKSLAEAPRNHFTIDRALGRARNRNLKINTVIDVGASDGRWAENCMKFFPEASYLLVEAQPAHEEVLNKFITTKTKAEYVLAAAGPSDGEVYFDDSQLFGGIASKEKTSDTMKALPQISLDKEVERRNLNGPFLLKLDTHGFEVPILRGASDVLKETELLIIETYNFKLTDESLRFWEMCTYLDSLGFAVIDQADLMLRKKDHSFWQMDIFFIPKDNVIFEYNKYE
ncbi:FkbM family methyltransferase [Aureitalea sp. L0-47]|uniref:FkbM family methyltransferase n=1 Tax=Aureitalea sp. L0-47 TaxID=2816962 RepID=UPI0022382C52|nr:FkbM family methyltransferase [Aureitalea sp. L0-47]MCW5519190.1 FkbM family methyltransferase [Aureitalea sp. L0-47]